MTKWSQKQLLGRLRDNAKATDPITGTTVNAATEVVDLDTRIFDNSVFVIGNSGSNTLTYSVQVRSDYEAGTNFEVFTNEVTGSDEDEIILCRHGRVFIYVNSYITGDHTTYKIEAIAGT